ncbi:SH3 domain-containing protein [Streptomyces sp. GESEQ-35]|uniref:SH3 domain-containing protein n=1 Tax=Streptomyces sp. GESEQ-35 TaxID=2812657 RepID=UPI001B326F22|nr:SH3 domain-containing protein [Streptomyces sp. GESEQ-35]
MRTTPALRTLAVALLTGGSLAVVTAGGTAYAGDAGDGSSGSIWGTVASATKLDLRQSPTVHSAVVARLAPGSQIRVECQVVGQSVNGNPHWYWVVGAGAWASAAFVDTGGHRVPSCADPCPQWKNVW